MGKKLLIPFLSVVGATVTAQSGLGMFESLRLLLVPGPFTIGAAVACLLVSTGAYALAPLSRTSVRRTWISKLSVFVSGRFQAVSAAFIGWPVGLCVAELLQGRFSNLPLGFALTLITALFLLAYVWVNHSVRTAAEQLSKSLFRPRRSIVAVRGMGLSLLMGGGYIATAVVYPITANWLGV